MAYRMVDTETWNDPWFEDLQPEAKLLFLYLWTNNRCNSAGMYRISRKVMEVESGVNGTYLDSLSDKVEYCAEERIVWVKNFFRRQCQNPKFGKSALNAIKHFPVNFRNKFLKYNSKTIKSFEIDIPYGYRIDTHLETQIPSVTVTDTVTDSIRKEVLYGTFKNVRLTEKEYEELIKVFGEKETEEKIEGLSIGIASKGYRYKNHYATILSWHRKNTGERKSAAKAKADRERKAILTFDVEEK